MSGEETTSGACSDWAISARGERLARSPHLRAGVRRARVLPDASRGTRSESRREPPPRRRAAPGCRRDGEWRCVRSKHRRGMVVGFAFEIARVLRLEQRGRRDGGHRADVADEPGDQQRDCRALEQFALSMPARDVPRFVREDAENLPIVSREPFQIVEQHERTGGQRQRVRPQSCAFLSSTSCGRDPRPEADGAR